MKQNPAKYKRGRIVLKGNEAFWKSYKTGLLKRIKIQEIVVIVGQVKNPIKADM
ncbi:MAG: hypothetical protein M0P13_06235 [Fibrobacteraceae bacterium]|nr:hypothetical protein [Fibrobacteraceae bacterium]